jgi:hypothetical protein
VGEGTRNVLHVTQEFREKIEGGGGALQIRKHLC